MTAPSKENERLAERLASIAAALKPPAKVNGHAPASFVEEALLATAPIIAQHVKERIAEAVAPLQQRLDVLEKKRGVAPLSARLADVEAKLAEKVTYGGVWRAEAAYQSMEMVTFKGQLWMCQEPNSGVKPPANCWRLMHRRENL